MESMNASDFKAKCLKILDRVKETGESILILKRGRPVAEVIPPRVEGAEFPQETLAGTVKVSGDIVEPVLPASDWESLAPK